MNEFMDLANNHYQETRNISRKSMTGTVKNIKRNKKTVSKITKGEKAVAVFLTGIILAAGIAATNNLKQVDYNTTLQRAYNEADIHTNHQLASGSYISAREFHGCTLEGEGAFDDRFYAWMEKEGLSEEDRQAVMDKFYKQFDACQDIPTIEGTVLSEQYRSQMK